MKEFFSKNKVFIAGMLQFVITAIIEVTSDTQGIYNAWIIGFSATVAGLTYLGRNLRGQWASVSMSVLSSVMVIGGLHDSQIPITLQVIMIRIVMPLALALLGIFFTSPPKSREYEHTETIVTAKEEAAAQIQAKKNS